MMECKDACKMRFATYILDANLQQGPGDISFLHFARPVPSEMKITKIDRAVILERPGGMDFAFVY